MRNTLLLFITLFTTFSFAQGNKIQFTYNQENISGKLKTSLNNLEENITVKGNDKKETFFKISQISNVIINDEEYVSAKVLFDFNLTKNISVLDYASQPNYKEYWLLLKVLVKGEYNLYQYSTNNFSQFYYQDINTKEIKPLIYKEYLISNYLKKNNYFRSQLRKELPLYSFDFKEYEKIAYNQSNLIRYFNKLNNYDEEKGIEKMNLKVSVFSGFFNNFQNQLNFSPVAINSLYLKDYEFEKKTTITFGLSGDIFINKKATQAVFAEAAFTQYKTNYYLDYYSPELSKIDFEFQSNIVLLNFGYKQFFNLSPNSQLYASASFATNFFFTSKNEVSYHLFLTGYDHLGNYFENHYDQVLKRNKNFSNVGGKLALGYKFKKHYFMEADYHFGFSDYQGGGAYNMTSFKAGYTF